MRRRRDPPTNSELLKVMRTFEVNVTQRCNAVCEHCDRLVGVINIRDTDVTEDQMRLAVDAMQDVGYQPRLVSVAGGEPMVNGDLVGIIHQLERLGKNIAVLTNRVTEYTLPKLAKKRTWFKSSPLEEKQHVPFLVSPTDAGMSDSRSHCAVQQKCGISFSAFGFSMCPVADSLGHVLRINPYSDTPTAVRIMDICKHCPHSVRRGPRLELYRKALDGDLEYPSPTLAEGLVRFKKDPISFPRFGETESPSVRTNGKPRVSLPIVMPTGYRAAGVNLPSVRHPETL